MENESLVQVQLETLYVWDITKNYEESIPFKNTHDLTAVAFSLTIAGSFSEMKKVK